MLSFQIQSIVQVIIYGTGLMDSIPRYSWIRQLASILNIRDPQWPALGQGASVEFSGRTANN